MPDMQQQTVDNLEDEDLEIWGAWLAKTKQIRVDRHCLRCNRNFLAFGKVNRLCKPCKSLLQGVCDIEEVRVGVKRGIIKDHS